MNKAWWHITGALALVLLMAACSSGLEHEAATSLPNGQWGQAQQEAFPFEITNTQHAYNVYYTLRYTLDYPFNNLYLNYYLQDSTGQTLQADLQEMLLSNPKTGEPAGSGMGDIFALRFKGLQNVRFENPGTYVLVLENAMRPDSLNGIVSVGMQLEKAEQATP